MQEQLRSELSAVKAELAATEEQLTHEKAARSALETKLEQRVVSNLEVLVIIHCSDYRLIYNLDGLLFCI